MNQDRIVAEYRIRMNIDRPEKKIIEEFKNFPTACISDAYRRRQTLPSNIKPVWDVKHRVAGSVITVSGTPSDEILALKAIEIAQPGDVIIVTGGYEASSSFWGGVMSTMAKVRGVAGLITDGKIRDLADCRELEFPIWATGVTPIAPTMDVPPGELNLPITIGEVIIKPGDLVVADEDGVVVVPQKDIHSVKDAVNFRLEKEKQWLEKIYSTEQMILKDVVDELLAKRNVEYLDK